MRRVAILAVMTTVLLVAVGAGVALAENFFTLTPNDDTKRGTAERDTVFAGAGDDLVFGRANRDRLFGQGDDDDLYGQDGSDELFGDRGNDFLVGGPGEDQLNGAGGDDVIVAGDDGVSDEIQCGTGEDLVFLSGPDNSSLAQAGCEEKENFKSLAEAKESNPDGTAGE